MPLPTIQPFPPDCPPQDAAPLSGVFYRLASKDLAVGEDTEVSSWLRPYQTHGPHYKKFDEVAAHGLSVFADLVDVLRARKITPWMAKKSVAEVTVTEQDGVMLHSPTVFSASHHDWWTDPIDLQPEAIVIETGTGS